MTAPRRIAFGITELDPGGAERMLTELVTRLDRTQWEPHVYCLGPEAHFSHILRDRGVPVTCFHARGWHSAPRVLWRWQRELRRFRPEILYGWLFHASLLGRIAGRWAGVPRVISGIRVAERRRAWHGQLDRLTNSWVDKNVCVSRGVADFVEQQWGLHPAKTVVIPNGIDGKRFELASPFDWLTIGIPPGSRVLLTIGRLEHQKGIDVLLNAILPVFAKHPDSHLVIVGEGPDRIKLEQRALALNLESRIHFLGRRNDVPELLKASTALVLPSRWEGMPNVVLEAMAAGKPIVASAVEGVPELVHPGRNGWLVPPGRPPELAAALENFLASREGHQGMGQESQRIYQKEFTIELFVARHVKLFEELVTSPVVQGC